MQLDREYILRMIKGRSAGAVVVEGSGGGGGGSVALGPLLTSLNAEAMPTAEGYLHWTGSAWAFDTPTGGDPVDLTPYALKTWVQDNFAYKNDLVNFITKTEADGYYAALNHTHANYLPMSAGPNKALTGSLYITGSNGIQWAGSPGVGMLCYMPSSGWTGISASQWGVGATSAQGVIRSNANDILHYRNGTNYKIWDAYNFTPSDYLPLTGGTVQSLTVTNGLDADSITVSSIVNSDTLAEYLDADAMQTWGDGRYLKLSDKAGLFTQLANYDGALQITIGGTQKSLTIAYANASGSANTAVNADKLDNHHADDFALASSLGNYLPLTGGTVNGNLNVKGTIQAQDSSGNNKVIIYGTTGNIRAEKVYIGGSTSGYEAATHNWVTSQGYQANVIETVKVAGTALTPTNKAVDIPSATSDGSTFGVVAIGTGFVFDEDRLCVDTSTFVTRTWADGRYLPLAGGTMHGSLMMQSDLSADNFPARAGLAIGMLAQLNQHATQGDNGYRGGVFFMYRREQQGGQSIAQDKMSAVIISCLSEYKSNWYSSDYGLAITADDIKFKGALLATQSWVNGRGFASAQDLYDLGTLVTAGYLPLTAGSSHPLTGDLWLNGNFVAGNPNNTANDDSAKIAFYTNKNYPNISPYIQAINENIYGRKRLSVFQKNVSDWDTPQVEVFTIKPDGNVGIGTNTPAYKLDVNGNTGVTGSLDVSIEMSVGDVTNGGVWLSDSALGVWTMSGTSRQETKLMSLASGGVTFSGDTIMTGKLAVGTTTFDGSNAKLQVGGNMFATGSITSKSNAGNVSLGNGNISATNLYISTVVFGSSNNDPAIYIGNGHVYARNSQGQTTMIV